MALLLSRASKDHEDDTSQMTLAALENAVADGSADAPFGTAAAHTATTPNECGAQLNRASSFSGGLLTPQSFVSDRRISWCLDERLMRESLTYSFTERARPTGC